MARNAAYSAQEMHSLGHVVMASSMHSSFPPSGRITCAFSSSSPISKTSGQSSAQAPQPTQHSSSKETLRPIVCSFSLKCDRWFLEITGRWQPPLQRTRGKMGASINIAGVRLTVFISIAVRTGSMISLNDVWLSHAYARWPVAKTSFVTICQPKKSRLNRMCPPPDRSPWYADRISPGSLPIWLGIPLPVEPSSAGSPYPGSSVRTHRE